MTTLYSQLMMSLSSLPIILPALPHMLSLGSMYAIVVTVWELGRTVCVYSMIQRREKEKDSRYIQKASAPTATPCIRPVTCLRHKYTCNNSILPITIPGDTRHYAPVHAFPLLPLFSEWIHFAYGVSFRDCTFTHFRRIRSKSTINRINYT